MANIWTQAHNFYTYKIQQQTLIQRANNQSKMKMYTKKFSIQMEKETNKKKIIVEKKIE